MMRRVLVWIQRVHPVTWGVSLGVALVAGLGSLATDPTDGWYRRLPLPSWTPPDWVFPVGWTLIFLLIALGLRAGGRHEGASTGERRRLWGWAVANGAANVLWSVCFFGLHRPAVAFWEALVLLGTIGGLAWALGRIRPRLAWWMLPYALWVMGATVLTWTIATALPGGGWRWAPV